MKNCILIFFLLLPLKNLFAQCQVDSILLEKYDRDVKDLALRRIFLFDHPDKNLIEIPQIWQDTIWSGLAAIFNDHSIPERDTVFDIYCIHHESTTLTSFTEAVYVEFNSAWTYDSIFHIHTGNSALDSLFLTHGVIFDSYFFGGTIIVKTTRPINTKAFAAALELFSEVTDAEESSSVGDSNRITYEKINNTQYFNFHLRWGDCPAGCINRRIWHFSISTGCLANYIGRTDQLGGDGFFPSPPNCNITSSAKELKPIKDQVHIFPNPFNDNIELVLENVTSAALKLYDCSGRLMFNSNFTGEISLNTSSLRAGIYFMEISNGKFRAYRKIIKI